MPDAEPSRLFRPPDERERPEWFELLRRIQESLPRLEERLHECDDHWGGEDGVYRFYHGSFKMYRLQEVTERAVSALREVLPSRGLHPSFLAIVRDGTGKVWQEEHNARWLEQTRPILEAFFHARYFLDMAVKYGKTLEQPPMPMPSGWAALLTLYGL